MRRSASLAVLSASIAAIMMLMVYGIRTEADPVPSNAAPQASSTPLLDFPDGTATASEQCGACHQSIYKEFSEGFGGDLQWADMKNYPPSEPAVKMLEGVAKGMARSPTAHAAAGNDPWPLDAIAVEEHGKKCNVCHYPQPLEYPNLAAAEIHRPKPRAADQEAGITCASCHLTPDGKIRGPYEVDAPHATVKDERIKTSVACAFCHSEGKRVVGKQTQTFLEWREDFYKPGLGMQQCQDCHMPKTTRKLADDFDVPERVSGRHVWTGGHSFQRIGSALTLAIVQGGEGQRPLEFHVTNVGAGHSVPTGSNRRAVYLRAEIVDFLGGVVAARDWMFAPWYGDRPDDKTFVEADKTHEHPYAAMQADLQGPHETIIRAGEQRVLGWSPEIPQGRYTVRARLIYDLNRYNDRGFGGDQREIARSELEIGVASVKADAR